MKALTLLLLVALLWAAVIDGGLRQYEADRTHDAAVGACLARTYKTMAQCQEAP